MGEGVTKFKTGDRVYVNTFLGAYAELIVHDAELVYPLPDCISFAQATAVVNSYPTAYYGLFNLAKAKPGETVFVHGASGAVGSAAVQIARAYGLRVVGSAGSQQGLELIEKEGAHFTVNHREPGYLDKALEFTDGKGFDVILEMNATKKLADDCYEVTNVFHRMQLAKQLLITEAQKFLNNALSLSIQFYGNQQLHQQAWEIAQQFNLSAAYDAHYLALAQRFQASFYTADKRLFN